MKPRKLGARKRRVETGPVVFGPDWPGVFIRGDNACAYGFNLRILLTEVCQPGFDPILTMYLTQLADLLESCRVTESERAKP